MHQPGCAGAETCGVAAAMPLDTGIWLPVRSRQQMEHGRGAWEPPRMRSSGKRTMKKLLSAITVSATLAVTSMVPLNHAFASERLKIGFLATLSGPLAVWGQHMRDGFMLAVRQAHGKLGGKETEVVLLDARLQPAAALVEVQKLQAAGGVDIMTGVVFSSVMSAVYQPIVDSGTIFIGANAGPAYIAGQGCSKYFFSTSWQDDQNHEVMGHYASQMGFRRVVIIAPNYRAGRDAAAAFKRHYNGEVAAEFFTKLGQADFKGDLLKVVQIEPDAVFAFMPGGMGVNLVKQYAEAGLKDWIPLMSTFTIDEITLRATKDLAIGHVSSSQWAPNIDNPANARFVRDFTATYGYAPSHFAAQGYDAARLIDGAVDMAGLGDKEALLSAIDSAPFESVRGDFRFNNNHFPVQDFYAVQAVETGNKTYTTQAVSRVFDDFGDAYSGSCHMR